MICTAKDGAKTVLFGTVFACLVRPLALFLKAHASAIAVFGFIGCPCAGFRKRPTFDPFELNVRIPNVSDFRVPHGGLGYQGESGISETTEALTVTRGSVFVLESVQRIRSCSGSDPEKKRNR